jgi:hypothetical protein
MDALLWPSVTKELKVAPTAFGAQLPTLLLFNKVCLVCLGVTWSVSLWGVRVVRHTETKGFAPPCHSFTTNQGKEAGRIPRPEDIDDYGLKRNTFTAVRLCCSGLGGD